MQSLPLRTRLPTALALAVLALALAPGAVRAQDVPSEQSTVLAGLFSVSARFLMGGPDSRWHSGATAYLQQDSNLVKYAGLLGSVELGYTFEGFGTVTAKAFYLDLDAAVEAAIVRVEWERTLWDTRLRPTARVALEHLTASDPVAIQETENNTRLRLRVGIRPDINPQLRLILLGEAFAFQSQGAFREYRSYLGVALDASPAVTLQALHSGRFRSFGPASFQNSVLIQLRYTGAISSLTERSRRQAIPRN